DRRSRDLPGRAARFGLVRAGRAGRSLSRRVRRRLDRLVPPVGGGVHGRRPRVRAARAGGRGRGPCPSAPEARALRRHPVLRPAPGPVHRRDRRRRLLGDPRLRRARLRGDRASRRGAGPRDDPQPARDAARPPASRSRRHPACHPRPRRRRRRAGGGRRGQRRRRDRGRGLRRSPERVAAHLRALSPCDRLPACDGAPASDAGPADGRTGHRRRGVPLPARRPGPCAAHPGAGRRLPRPAREHPQRQPDAGDQGARGGLDRPERGDQEDLRLGGHPLRADAGRNHLRHELPQHARARLALRLSVRAGADAAGLRDPASRLQPARLDL
ncbi:MAG: Magnesium and cobalt transport protein CorA, partial [uncultured Solirubrobacteraceae bacterium]